MGLKIKSYDIYKKYTLKKSDNGWKEKDTERHQMQKRKEIKWKQRVATTLITERWNFRLMIQSNETKAQFVITEQWKSKCSQ